MKAHFEHSFAVTIIVLSSCVGCHDPPSGGREKEAARARRGSRGNETRATKEVEGRRQRHSRHKAAVSAFLREARSRTNLSLITRSRCDARRKQRYLRHEIVEEVGRRLQQLDLLVAVVEHAGKPFAEGLAEGRGHLGMERRPQEAHSAFAPTLSPTLLPLVVVQLVV